MTEEADIRSVRQKVAPGDVWYVICAEQEWLPELKEPSKEIFSPEQAEAMAKEREEALAHGELPEVRLTSLDGEKLWRKYRYSAEIRRRGPEVFTELTVTYVGYHGVSDAMLSRYGLPREVEPVEKLRYLFDNAGDLQAIEWIEKEERIAVNGEPVLLDWDFTDLPAGFPSFRAPVVDNSQHSKGALPSELSERDNGWITVWLSDVLEDIQPPRTSHPAVAYEVQKWRKGDRWWHEAYYVKYRDVRLLAKRLDSAE